MQIGILGAGAVGGYYGGLLQKAGFDIHFLLHSDYEHVCRHGLVIESINGNFQLPNVQAYSHPEDMPCCDLVIIALKTTENPQLSGILPPLLKDSSLILTLQNGMGGEEMIAKIAGGGRIVSGLCFLCSNKTGPGYIRHLDYGLITLGDYRSDHQPAGITPRLELLATQFKSAGITVKTVEDLLLARWKKLVWNIPFNGLTVTHRMLTDQLLKDRRIRSLCRTLMQEVAEAAAACARPIEKDFIEKMMTDTEKMKPYAPSMMLDFANGRRMEIESIYGVPLRMARDAGIDMPETAKLYRQLKSLNPPP